MTFMRSFPNRIPLSPEVVTRVGAGVGAHSFERLYDNFGGLIDGDADAIVRRSADRYARWAGGDLDALT